MGLSSLRTAVAGVSGYAGGELARLLLRHPRLADTPPVFLGRLGEAEVPPVAVRQSRSRHATIRDRLVRGCECVPGQRWYRRQACSCTHTLMLGQHGSAENRPPCPSTTSPCLASSRLATNVLDQADRRRTADRGAHSGMVSGSGSNRSNGTPSGASERNRRMRSRASATA